jgi:hypothetical protein
MDGRTVESKAKAFDGIQSWEFNLDRSLSFFWVNVKRDIELLDKLIKEVRERKISLDVLNHILTVWKDISRHTKVKEIRLNIHGKGYGEYGGITLHSIEELQNMIDTWDPKGHIIHKTLNTDQHYLSLELA